MYRCSICPAVAPPSQKLLKHVIHGPGPTKPIRREIPVCQECHDEIALHRSRGASPDQALANCRRRRGVKPGAPKVLESFEFAK